MRAKRSGGRQTAKSQTKQPAKLIEMQDIYGQWKARARARSYRWLLQASTAARRLPCRSAPQRAKRSGGRQTAKGQTKRPAKLIEMQDVLRQRKSRPWAAPTGGLFVNYRSKFTPCASGKSLPQLIVLV